MNSASIQHRSRIDEHKQMNINNQQQQSTKRNEKKINRVKATKCGCLTFSSYRRLHSSPHVMFGCFHVMSQALTVN